MIKETIRFSSNWNNKLNCNYFTTIRLKNESKYILNRVYKIELKGKFLKQAEIVDIKHFFIHQLNELVSGLDTGYSAYETKQLLTKMYGNKVNVSKTPFSLILLKTLKMSNKTAPKINPELNELKSTNK